MKKIMLISGIALCAFTSIAFTSVSATPGNGDKEKKEKNFPSVVSGKNSSNSSAAMLVDSVYNTLNLSEIGLSKEIFEKAYTGYQYLLSIGKISRPGIITIADYSQPSSKKRLYIVDVNRGLVLHNTYVSHGKNSGTDYAKSFSNEMSSNKTSLGFMVTAETYYGGKGYSMRIDGMEAGINDNVRNRAVVMHAAPYVESGRAKSGIMMGRSFGCPAVPVAETKTIIDEIKGGTCMFLYGEDQNYVQRSRIINADFQWPNLMANNNTSANSNL